MKEFENMFSLKEERKKKTLTKIMVRRMSLAAIKT
jgi:hypothetical protein